MKEKKKSNKKTKELLFSITKKDLKIDYFSGTGAGGQHRNKHQNCVRLTHVDSGVTVTGQSNRDRVSNLKQALENLVKNPKFKIWHTHKVNEIFTGKKIEDIVEEMMEPNNLKIEIRNKNGKWIDEKELNTNC